MGGSEDGESSKSEKSSPPATGIEQNNVHVYPDWAPMQAYYGPRVAMPSYYNPAVASGHLPHPYMWGPQPMMSPYGTPYAAIYANGGVYAHPSVPLGAPVIGHGAVSEPLAGIPLSIDTPVKPPENDNGLMKKLKGFDGLAMSIGNGDANAKAEGSDENRLSQSADTEDSSDGSDGNTEEADKKKRKRSGERTSSNVEDEQAESKSPILANGNVLGLPIKPANGAAGHVMGSVASASVSTALELLNPAIEVKGNSTTVSSSNTAVSSEVWVQNEREIKRERRKQSNRESARRSRLRKQAEAEELGRKVDSLSAENLALKSEISQLVDNSKKIRLENASLLDKLKSLESEEAENAVDVNRNPADSTENLLSKVNNPGNSVNRNSEEGSDIYEKGSKPSGSKFHQLLSANTRADAVVAG